MRMYRDFFEILKIAHETPRNKEAHAGNCWKVSLSLFHFKKRVVDPSCFCFCFLIQDLIVCSFFFLILVIGNWCCNRSPLHVLEQKKGKKHTIFFAALIYQ